MLVGCSSPQPLPPTQLPAKSAQEVSLQTSPVTPDNLDDYLFLTDTFYVDVRDPNQFLSEGHVAGFSNLPFYGMIVKTAADDFGLFTLSKKTNEQGQVIANYGGIGSFTPRYQESESIINYLFPKDQAIVVMSTAGVESQYLLNLLLQLGYDGTLLYNAGNFSNSLGSLTAYRLKKNARHLVVGHEAYRLEITYDFGDLTPLDD
jgi:rhodanese-related sulfurtransferase